MAAKLFLLAWMIPLFWYLIRRAVRYWPVKKYFWKDVERIAELLACAGCFFLGSSLTAKVISAALFLFFVKKTLWDDPHPGIAYHREQEDKG